MLSRVRMTGKLKSEFSAGHCPLVLLHLFEKAQPIFPSFRHVVHMQSDGTSVEKSYFSSTLVNVALLKGWGLVLPAPSPEEAEGLRKALAEAASYISKVRQILQYCLKFALEMSATSAGATSKLPSHESKRTRCVKAHLYEGLGYYFEVQRVASNAIHHNSRHLTGLSLVCGRFETSH
jgi:hypothetical protein